MFKKCHKEWNEDQHYNTGIFIILGHESGDIPSLERYKLNELDLCSHREMILQSDNQGGKHYYILD